MRGNEEIDRREPHCRRHSAMSARPADQPRQIPVRNQLSRFEPCRERPHVFLKFGPFEMKRHVETREPFAKIRVDLTHRFAQNGVGGLASIGFQACGKTRGADAQTVALDQQRQTQRRLQSRACERHAGYNARMDKKTPVPPEERAEVRKEAVEAHEGDKALDDYDKQMADSFPASDPPAQP